VEYLDAAPKFVSLFSSFVIRHLESLIINAFYSPQERFIRKIFGMMAMPQPSTISALHLRKKGDGSEGRLVLRANLLLALLLVGLVPPNVLSAQAQSSTYDNLWQLAEWYDNDVNPVLQRVLSSGRFQYEYATVNDTDVTHDEWNVRRMRLGWRLELLRQFTLHTEAEFNPQEVDPFYMRLTDVYLQWSRSAPLAVTAGKHAMEFTMDGSTSSKELLTIDRSNLANNMWFPQEYMPGISVSGEVANWGYHMGMYSAGERNREFGQFNGSVSILTTINYNLAEILGADEALLGGNYVYQNPDANNTFTRQLQHMTSVNFRLEDGRWGVRADVSAASGYQDQSDLWGTMIMPFLNFTDELQFVARHTYLSSKNPNGVRLARYEKNLIDGQGDRYNELYLGVNYYFYGHKLKLQNGVQFGDMNDSARDGGNYSGVALTSGLRMSW